MKTAISWLSIAALVLGLAIQSAGTAQAAEVPGQATIWSFLGIPQGFNRVYDGVINRSGKRPGWERKPPLKRIADPANLESEVPAIKAAAEVKADADLAEQKIKAIKYLSDVGCTCSSQKADIQDALLAALDDCTEEVRYEAALAFCRASGNACSTCGGTCCGEDVTKKLKDMAVGQDDDGCWNESSPRVRAAAMNALNACELLAGPTEAKQEEIRELPVEQPVEQPAEETVEEAVEQTTSVPQFVPRPAPVRFDPEIEKELRIPLSPLMPAPGGVEPAGFIWAGKTKAEYSTSVLRYPGSNSRVDSQTRFRGSVVTPMR